MSNRTLAIRAALVIGTLVLGGIAYAFGIQVAEDRTGVDTNPSPTATAAKAISTTGWERFEDENAKMELSHPPEWRRLEDNSSRPLNETDSDDPINVRAVLGPNANNPMLLVRAIPLPAEIGIPEEITEEFLGVIQGQLDELIQGPDVVVADKRPTNHKGKLAWRYLYNFKDQATGREGSHVHYFIFDGAKINVLVFQALPAGELRELAPTFDKVLETFESEARIIPRTVVSLPPSPSPSPAG